MRVGLQPEGIVDGDGDLLLRAYVAFGGLDRAVARQELDLFQVAAIPAPELGAGALEVVGAETLDADLAWPPAPPPTSSMAGLQTPLSTLRPAPSDAKRMTRGQCGSLFHHCTGLSPVTPCRSAGALAYVFDVWCSDPIYSFSSVELRIA